MRTVNTDVYKFNELSEKSQERVYKYVQENWHNFYAWHNENQESLKEFAKLLGGTADFSVSLDGRGNHTKIINLPCYLEEDDPYRSQDSYKPIDWLYDNKESIKDCCPLTGYCIDEDLLDPMRKYLENPDDRTMEDLIQEGCDNWLKSYVQGWEHCYSDEYIADFMDDNEFEFTVHGEIWNEKMDQT